jgi:hypothetical protein
MINTVFVSNFDVDSLIIREYEREKRSNTESVESYEKWNQGLSPLTSKSAAAASELILKRRREDVRVRV